MFWPIPTRSPSLSLRLGNYEGTKWNEVSPMFRAPKSSKFTIKQIEIVWNTMDSNTMDLKMFIVFHYSPLFTIHIHETLKTTKQQEVELGMSPAACHPPFWRRIPPGTAPSAQRWGRWVSPLLALLAPDIQVRSQKCRGNGRFFQQQTLGFTTNHVETPLDTYPRSMVLWFINAYTWIYNSLIYLYVFKYIHIFYIHQSI